METPKRKRSRLPKDAARAHYLTIGGLAVLEQIRTDAAALDRRRIAIGPFARIDAGAVAGRDGKTRGAITNLFGSQASFQVEIMQMTLDADLLEIPCPDPASLPMPRHGWTPSSRPRRHAGPGTARTRR